MSVETKHGHRDWAKEELTCIVRGRLMTIQPELGALILPSKISLKKVKKGIERSRGL
jgi:hypothetical protein